MKYFYEAVVVDIRHPVATTAAAGVDPAVDPANPPLDPADPVGVDKVEEGVEEVAPEVSSEKKVKRNIKVNCWVTSSKRRKRSKPVPITKSRVKFHFKHWEDEFDEWVDCDSPRIQGHNLYTNPECKSLLEQERWQQSCHYSKYV
jgi:hypothetical protein